MEAGTVTENIANTDLLIRFVEVWHTDEASQQLVPMNAIAMHEDSSQATVSQHSHSDEMLTIIRDACQAKAVAMIRENDCSLTSLSQHVGCEIVSILCIPIVKNRSVRGAVLVGLGSVHGAVEVWGRDDRDELAMMNGHYSGLPSFEYITRYTRFPKGAGIPGSVWKSGQARVVQTLDKSSAFTRSFGCDPATVSAAVALPIADTLGFPKSVLMFLQAAQQPLSRQTVLMSGSMQPSSTQASDDDDDGDQAQKFKIQSIVSIDGPATGVQAGPEIADAQRSDEFERDIESVLSANAPLLVNHNSPAGNHRLIFPIYSEQNLASVLIMTY